MSYVVTYKIEGDFVIPGDILRKLPVDAEVQARIDELIILDDDTMTVSQLKELERLVHLRDTMTVDYNGLKISRSPLFDEEADLYLDRNGVELYIEGHEGQSLDFEFNGTDFEMSNPYFEDNYDTHLNKVQKVAKAFNANIEIVYVSDEAGDDQYTGKVIWKNSDKDGKDE